MNREEFIAKLRTLLNDISLEEQEQAIEFYQNYFEDAGPEKEEEIIKELGSPEKVALSIKRDLKAAEPDRKNGEYTEYGYREEEREENSIIKVEQKVNDSKTDNQTQKPQYKTYKTTNTGLLLLIVLLFFPVILPMMFVSFGTVFGLVLGFGIAGIGCIAAGVIAAVAGIGSIIAFPFLGFGGIGGALVCFGIGILFLFLTYYCCKLFPLLFGLFKTIFTAPVQERSVKV